MYQTLRSREKCPKQACKKHRSKDLLKREILASMTKEGRKRYLKKKKDKIAKKRKVRAAEKMNAHKLRLKKAKQAKEKRDRKKARTRIIQTMKQVVCIKKDTPDLETINRRRINAERRLIKRRIKKVFAFALRNESNPIKIITLIMSDCGIKYLPVSKYQKMV